MPEPVPHKCTNSSCYGWNTVTHYQHIRTDGTVHDFQVPNPPGTVNAIPIPQPCPIDGCITFNLPGVPPPPVYPAVFTHCLDCGNTEFH